MENKIQEYDSPIELIEETPMNCGQQATIFLVIDWEEEQVYVETSYDPSSYPMAVHNGLMTRIKLPNNTDARYLRSNIDDLMPRIESIAAGYESSWNGYNWIGKFTEDAQGELYFICGDIDRTPESIFSLFEDGGLYDAADWFQTPVEELTAETTDEEIKTMAELYNSDARGDLVVICGGADAIAKHLRYLRDEMKGEEE